MYPRSSYNKNSWSVVDACWIFTFSIYRVIVQKNRKGYTCSLAANTKARCIRSVPILPKPHDYRSIFYFNRRVIDFSFD